MRRLLFISNLFPDEREPYRGLDNATILHHLRDRWEIEVLALRPRLPWQSAAWKPRPGDEALAPRFVRTPYLPKVGSAINHRLYARAIAAALPSSFDLVLSSWIYPDSCAVALLAEKQGFSFVSIAQGSDVHQYLRSPTRRRIISRCMPKAVKVITRSGELARLLARDAGLAPAQLQPIYNGVDPLFLPGDRAAARSRLGLPGDVPIALFVGNFYAIKNPLLLIDAFARVRQQPALREALLVMIGGGPLEAEAHQRAGADSGVRFAGRQAASEVAAYMHAADLLVLPSQNEGVPNVILEAFRAGLPVVASRVGGIPEVHVGDAHGRLIAPNDVDALTQGLCEVFLTPPDRSKIACHGAVFTWAKTVDEYHTVLEAALA